MCHALICIDYAFLHRWASLHFICPRRSLFAAIYVQVFALLSCSCLCVHTCLWICIFCRTSSHSSARMCCPCVCVLWLLEPLSHHVSADLSSTLTQRVLVPSALFSKLGQGVRQEHITAEDGSMLSGLTQDKEKVLAECDTEISL